MKPLLASNAPSAALPARRGLTRRSALLAVVWSPLAAGAGVARQDAQQQPVIHMVEVASARLEVQFAPGLDAPTRDLALAWVRRSASAIAAYFGRFPLPQVELLVEPVPGRSVRSGVSYAEPTPLLKVRVGSESTAAHFLEDWILVHEMVHLAIPQVPPAQQWLHEGIATYVGALARGRAGWLRASEVWHAWMREMPRGQPQEGDRGLDHTPTWGRTYWGGALFALLADVQIRRHGSAGRGLQHALQGVLAAGGDYRVAWPVDRILATADAAVGQATLGELYARMKDHAVRTDLASLWHDLGVTDGQLRDDAPLAAIRRAILS